LAGQAESPGKSWAQEAVGLHRIGYDLDLRQYSDGHWCASFYVTGIAHSILGGSGWEPTSWRAVQ